METLHFGQVYHIVGPVPVVVGDDSGLAGEDFINQHEAGTLQGQTVAVHSQTSSVCPSGSST